MAFGHDPIGDLRGPDLHIPPPPAENAGKMEPFPKKRNLPFLQRRGVSPGHRPAD
jgi:hypothetical protein